MDVLLGKGDAVRMRENVQVVQSESATMDEKLVALDDLELVDLDVFDCRCD